MYVHQNSDVVTNQRTFEAVSLYILAKLTEYPLSVNTDIKTYNSFWYV